MKNWLNSVMQEKFVLLNRLLAKSKTVSGVGTSAAKAKALSRKRSIVDLVIYLNHR